MAFIRPPANFTVTGNTDFGPGSERCNVSNLEGCLISASGARAGLRRSVLSGTESLENTRISVPQVPSEEHHSTKLLSIMKCIKRQPAIYVLSNQGQGQ
eukprot:46103-Hanusia_phi.AAC.1